MLSVRFARLLGTLCLLSVSACENKETEQNPLPANCTYVGFDPVTRMAFWDHPFYNFILMSGLSKNEPVTYLDLQFYKNSGSKPQLGKAGKINVDIDPNDCGTCAVISTNCKNAICEELYFAGEGEIDVTEWGGKKGESFSGSLNNAVFYQIEADANGYYKYKDNGKIWCVPEYKFSTVIQSVHDYSD